MQYAEHIANRLKADDFVQFKDGKLIYRGGPISVDLSPNSPSSMTHMIKIGYATDVNGTGFTMINSDDFEYFAMKWLLIDGTPVAGDFTGLWARRRGLPGNSPTPIPGADGQQAGFRTNFSVVVTADKPGTGNIRFNHTDLSLATEMYLDEMIPAGVDISGVINQLVEGMTFMLRLNIASSAVLAVFELTDVPTDNGDWFTIPIVTRVVPAINFADGDQCVFQFFGGGGAAEVTEEAIITAADFPRLVPNGGGGKKFIDQANSDVQSICPVYKLPAFTITDVPNLPTISTFPHGAVVRLHQDCLVGAGANPMGIFIQADRVNDIWRPFGYQILFYQTFGTIASPTCTLTAAGKFDLGAGGDPVIPGTLLNIKSRLRFAPWWKKVGATTPTLRVNFGTDLSARENNSIIYTQSVPASTNEDILPESLLTFISATGGTSSNRAIRGSVAVNSTLDVNTLLNIASPMKATFEASVLASDTANLLSMAIIWEG